MLKQKLIVTFFIEINNFLNWTVRYFCTLKFKMQKEYIFELTKEGKKPNKIQQLLLQINSV